MVTTSDKKKSEMEVNTNSCVIVKYWRLSSIRAIFVDYQTSKLQYNYLLELKAIDFTYFYFLSHFHFLF